MICGAVLHAKSLLVQKNIHVIHSIKNSRSTPLYHVPFLITQVPSIKLHTLATLNCPSLLQLPSPTVFVKDMN